MIDPNKTIVRGTDNHLYYVTPTGPLERVQDTELLAWDAAVQIIQPLLDALFVEHMQNVMASCHQTIQIVIPDVDLP